MLSKHPSHFLSSHVQTIKLTWNTSMRLSVKTLVSIYVEPVAQWVWAAAVLPSELWLKVTLSSHRQRDAANIGRVYFWTNASASVPPSHLAADESSLDKNKEMRFSVITWCSCDAIITQTGGRNGRGLLCLRFNWFSESVLASTWYIMLFLSLNSSRK